MKRQTILLSILATLVIALIVWRASVAYWNYQVGQWNAKAARASNQQGDDDEIPANAGNPQVFWAHGDTRSCATVEFDPAQWSAPRSMDHGSHVWIVIPRVTLRNDHGHGHSSFQLYCSKSRYSNYVYDVESDPNNKVFSPSAAVAWAKHEAPNAYRISNEPYTTPSGVKGARVLMSLERDEDDDIPSYVVVYVFPLEASVNKQITPTIVTLEGETTSRSEGLRDFDAIVNTLTLHNPTRDFD